MVARWLYLCLQASDLFKPVIGWYLATPVSFFGSSFTHKQQWFIQSLALTTKQK